jgi:predicted amidohydrolase YtcJ
MLEAVEPYFLYGISKKSELIKTLKERCEREKRDIILALGWDTVHISDLSREDLDEINKEIPLIVFDPSFHGGVINSKALEILDKLKNFQEKEIGRNLKGEMSGSGRITEEFVSLAFDLVESKKTIEEMTEKSVSKIEDLLRRGVTAIHEMVAFTPREIMTIFGTYEKWKEKHPGIEFPITLFSVRPEILSLIIKNSERVAEIIDKLYEFIQKNVVGVKLFADGSIGSYTALMEKSYLDKETAGIQFDTIRNAKEAFRMAKELGILRINTHAIGNKGIRNAIEFAQHWFRESEGKGLFRIEHYEISGEKEILLATKENGIWVSSQPNFVNDIVVYEKRLGKERTRIICPHREIIEHNIPMMFGTDGMPSGMLNAIFWALHHPNKEQRISFEEAVIASAAMAGEYERSQRGKFFEGAIADFIVIDPSTLDFLTKELDEREIKEILGSYEKFSDLSNSLDEGVRIVIKSGKIVKNLEKILK